MLACIDSAFTFIIGAQIIKKDTKLTPIVSFVLKVNWWKNVYIFENL